MAETRKKTSRQAEFTFRPPVLGKPKRTQKEAPFLPVYHPPAGEGLKELVLRLAPILAKSGWEARVVEENGQEAVELQKGEKTRRLTPDELAAWQALLPGLEGNSFSVGLFDRKE